MPENTVSHKFIQYDPRLIPRLAPLSSPLDTTGEYTAMITSHQWKAHITGMVIRLTELSAWLGSDDEIQDAIDKIHEWLSQEGYIVDCNEIMACVGANSTIIQLVSDSNNAINRVATNQWTTNVNEWNSVYNQDTSAYLPTLSVKKFLPNVPTTDESSILCDVLGIWLDSWVIRALQLIEVLQGLVNFGSGISSAIGILAGAHPDRVSQFILSTFSGFAGAQFRGTVLELSELKDAYENPLAIEDVKCALIKAFAYRSIGIDTYFRRMSVLPTLTTTIDGTLIANHMLDVIADSNLPDYAQPAYLYLVELFDCVLDTNDPVGSCGVCLPALPCGVTNNRINYQLPPLPAIAPFYAGSDVIVAGGIYYALRENNNSWLEYIAPSGGEICFYRIAGVYRANSTAITNGKFVVYCDGVKVQEFAMVTPKNNADLVFGFDLAETIICNKVRLAVSYDNVVTDYVLIRNWEMWRKI